MQPDMPPPGALPEEDRKPVGCLRAFLAVTFVVNAVLGVTYLYYAIFGGTPAAEAGAAVQSFPAWFLPTIAVISLANCVFMVAIWLWRRWGAYGYGLLTLVTIGINFLAGAGPTAFAGLLGVALLIYVVRPVWDLME
ncbi:MAG: hypothetical protein HC837_00900 [Chloroflexaceae bacterium]|nr:hypothetical protein [Chloroflexaceae bacterium]